MKSKRTSKVRLVFVGLALAVLAGCGGSMRQVQGARFDLNGQEDTLADQYNNGDPRQAPPEVRCQYWNRRSVEAGQPHAMGVLLWPSNHFVTLQEWAEAKRAQMCGQHHRHEREIDGTTATAAISDGSVVATFREKGKCRETLVDVRGQPFAAQPSWSPCTGALISRASVRLIFGDGQTVSATTDSNGREQFDLGGIRWTDDALKSGQAQLAVGSDPPMAVVSLAGLPAYDERQQKQAAEAEQEQAAQAREKNALTDKILQWAPRSISYRTYTTVLKGYNTYCVNKVDVQVPCDSAAANERRRSSSKISRGTSEISAQDVAEQHFVLRNTSTIPMRCRIGGRNTMGQPGEQWYSNEDLSVLRPGASRDDGPTMFTAMANSLCC